jgi:ATP-dependent Clp protease ATP-binding subunit ClpA
MTDKEFSKAKVSSSDAQKELDKVEKQCDQFNKEIKDLTLDRMNEAPKEELEPQTKLSQKEIAKIDAIVLKPKRTISSKEKFNETHRSDYNFAIERVNFIAQNNEIIGETIDMWTKPFPGMPAEWWEIPTNKPVNAPRHVADQIKRATYHRLVMQDKAISSDHAGTYTGTMIADTVKQRLDAHPIIERKSVFMGASGF